MAKAKPKATWTESEKDLAERIIARAKKYSGSFLERYREAAKSYQYKSYGDLPQGVKAYISALGNKRRGKAKPAKKTLALQTMQQATLPLFEEGTSAHASFPTEAEWFEEAKVSKAMRHGLHPEDEKGLIEHFSQAQ